MLLIVYIYIHKCPTTNSNIRMSLLTREIDREREREREIHNLLFLDYLLVKSRLHFFFCIFFLHLTKFSLTSTSLIV
jgi:hypothetical protein